MTRLGLAILLSALLLLPSCGERSRDNANIGDVKSALRPKLAGFSRSTDIRIFNRENLWEYNDGAAEIFLAQGFERIAVADYTDSQGELTAEIYLFSKAAGADSIYARYFRGDEKRIDVGDRGFIAPGQLIFQRGRLLVMINYYSDIPDTIIADFAGGLCAGLSR